MSGTISYKLQQKFCQRVLEYNGDCSNANFSIRDDIHREIGHVGFCRPEYCPIYHGDCRYGSAKNRAKKWLRDQISEKLSII